jgi:cystathionine gamma-lyase/cystathionine beta-lyase/cystathionine gamma-lyase/homocysteine desulfhydrase
MDSFLVMRGTKTLAVRMRQHDENGRLVAQFLSENPKVEKVYYPGLKSHPQHELARRQMSGFGGMISFETGSLDNARRVLESVRLCTMGESLGGVETLISHPATMTHASVPEVERNRLGITDGLVRISVGIEDAEDIIEDLDQALNS